MNDHRLCGTLTTLYNRELSARQTFSSGWEPLITAVCRAFTMFCQHALPIDKLFNCHKRACPSGRRLSFNLWMRPMPALPRLGLRHLDCEHWSTFNQLRRSVLDHWLWSDWYRFFLCLHKSSKLRRTSIFDTILLHVTLFPCLNVKEVLFVIYNNLFNCRYIVFVA